MKPTITEWVTALYERMPAEVQRRAIIGGGALRAYFDGTQTKDIDLFFSDALDYTLAVSEFELAGATFEAGCPNGTEIVHYNGAIFNLVGFHYFQDAGEAAGSFDFRCVSMAAEYVPLDGAGFGGVQFYAAHGAIADAESKTLNFQTPQRTERVIKRLRRYVDELGYTPSDAFVEALPSCSLVSAGTGVTY